MGNILIAYKFEKKLVDLKKKSSIKELTSFIHAPIYTSLLHCSCPGISSESFPKTYP